MSIFKRGNVYWYHFLFNGEHIQKSTKQGNPRTARQIEAAYRTALAKGEVGIKSGKPRRCFAILPSGSSPMWKRATRTSHRQWSSTLPSCPGCSNIAPIAAQGSTG